MDALAACSVTLLLCNSNRSNHDSINKERTGVVLKVYNAMLILPQRYYLQNK